MKNFKIIFYQKIFEIHKYLSELDKKSIEDIEKEYEKIKDKNKKEIIYAYLQFRRKNK